MRISRVSYKASHNFQSCEIEVEVNEGESPQDAIDAARAAAMSQVGHPGLWSPADLMRASRILSKDTPGK